MVFDDLRAVAHFERDLSLVLSLLHAVAAETVTQTVALPFDAGRFHDLLDSSARIDLKYRRIR